MNVKAGEAALQAFGAGNYSEAEYRFQGAVDLDPDSLNDRIYLACTQDIQGNRAGAASNYQKAISISPLADVAYTNLGYVLLATGNIQAAAQYVQHAVSLSISSKDRRLLLPSFREEDLPNPTSHSGDLISSSVCLALGVKLQESGRFQDAKLCFRRAIELNGRNGPAWYALVQTSRVTRTEAVLVEEIIKMIRDPRVSYSDLVHLHFAAGKALDDLGEYEVAMRHFDEANLIALKAAGSPFDVAGFEKDVSSVIRTYTRSRIKELKKFGSRSELPLPIIGMIRSGTTLVEQIISSHSDVVAGGEMGFWRENGYKFIRAGSKIPTLNDIKRLSIAYPRELRETDSTALRVTDKMPQNFVAVGLIHLVFPSAPILACLRDPVDTCLSIYMTCFRHGLPFANSRDDIVAFYRQYQRLMNHWRDVIPTDKLLEVKYEDLLSDPEATTRRLIGFSGLEWQDRCLHPENNLRTVTTASVWQVRQAVYTTSVERWRRYEPWLGSLAELRTS